MITPETIVEKLGLLPHPEGGYYKEIYRTEEILDKKALPERYSSSRNISTSIYYMLKGEQISHFHKLKSDEIWHFYSGSPVIIHLLGGSGYSKIVLGSDLERGEIFQHVIKTDMWFAAELENKNSYCLIGCTVAPGFSFEDFLLASRDELANEFPDYLELITKLTYDK
jgi:uncharacterized protein